jgi:hypothetical protein
LPFTQFAYFSGKVRMARIMLIISIEGTTTALFFI